jgi:hypothetical protein
MHRDRTDFSLINRPKLKSPQAEVNYSVLVYILSLLIRSVLNWINTGIELMVCSTHAYV